MDAFDLLRLIEDLSDIRKHFPACLALPNPYIFFKLYNDQVLHINSPSLECFLINCTIISFSIGNILSLFFPPDQLTRDSLLFHMSESDLSLV